MKSTKAARAAITVALAGLLGAVGASSASAAFDFEAGGYPAAISGVNQGAHLFTVENEEVDVECAKATFTGEIAEPDETPEVLPKYESCLAAGSFSATVNANGCVFRLYATEEVAAEEFDGTADLVCPEGKKITMTAVFCEIQIGSQSGVGKVDFENEIEASPVDLTVDISLTGVKYATKGSAFCPLFGTGEKSDGTYDGQVLAEAAHEAAAIDFGVALLATELCKSAEINPCKAPYIEGTVLAAELEATTNAVFKYEFEGAQKTIVCSKSSLTAATGKHVGLELAGELNPLVFPVCEKECDAGALNAPFETRTAPDGNTGNGPMNLFKPGEGPIFFAGCTGKHSCAYSSSSLVGKITGGKDAIWVVSDTLGTKLPSSHAKCGASLTISARYQFYKPVVGAQPQMWVSKG